MYLPEKVKKGKGGVTGNEEKDEKKEEGETRRREKAFRVWRLEKCFEREIQAAQGIQRNLP